MAIDWRGAVRRGAVNGASAAVNIVDNKFLLWGIRVIFIVMIGYIILKVIL